jgi:lipid-A-disaccharide synthase
MAKRLGIPVIYYITPQVWAWRKGRVKFLKRWVDRLLCIFPFEESFFREHGLTATFVGNPLLELMDLGTLKKKEPEAKRVGILPGSRKKEIFSLLPVFAAAASSLVQSDPEIRFSLIQAPHVNAEWIQDLWPKNLPVDIFPTAKRYEELRRCRFVIAASGTVTFECALLGVPTMLAYKVAPLSYYVGRALIKVQYIGMANLILQQRVFPEFIQHDATPQALAAQARVWFEHPEYLEEIITTVNRLPDMVGPDNATTRAAQAVLEYIQVENQ